MRLVSIVSAAQVAKGREGGLISSQLSGTLFGASRELFVALGNPEHHHPRIGVHVLGLSAKLFGAVSPVLCVVDQALPHVGKPRGANGRSAFHRIVTPHCTIAPAIAARGWNPVTRVRPAPVAQRAGFRFAGEAALGMGEVVIAAYMESVSGGVCPHNPIVGAM